MSAPATNFENRKMRYDGHLECGCRLQETVWICRFWLKCKHGIERFVLPESESMVSAMRVGMQ